MAARRVFRSLNARPRTSRGPSTIRIFGALPHFSLAAGHGWVGSVARTARAGSARRRRRAHRAPCPHLALTLPSPCALVSPTFRVWRACSVGANRLAAMLRHRCADANVVAHSWTTLLRRRNTLRQHRARPFFFVQEPCPSRGHHCCADANVVAQCWPRLLRRRYRLANDIFSVLTWL